MESKHIRLQNRFFLGKSSGQFGGAIHTKNYMSFGKLFLKSLMLEFLRSRVKVFHIEVPVYMHDFHTVSFLGLIKLIFFPSLNLVFTPWSSMLYFLSRTPLCITVKRHFFLR